ncbi:MAG: ribonuclease J [Chloroflexi bacterium]|nr:ribonuclease J [Chloroflexota bacterium]
MQNQPLRVIPLGGLGEIGKNMMALEYGQDIIVIDAGVMFPEEDMLGVDLVIPDITYLRENRERVRAIFITHGHEDHTGALPYVLSALDVPVYAPRLAAGLINVKLKEHRIRKARVHEVEPGKPVIAGDFSVEFFRVCHSIPDAMGLAIRTPLGLIIHTGDFKIDHTPADGQPTDLGHLGRGVLLLMSDSTYAEVEGYTPSEQVVGEALEQVIAVAPGRVMVATFASLIARIQQVIDAAALHGRKVCVVGRSMVDNVKMALDTGYLQDPNKVLAPTRALGNLKPHQVVIMTTGSQGEPTSALVRIANGDHKEISIIPGDTVVISASPIPGNETVVSRTIDNLYRQGAEVLYDKIATVHVHGHASREELKIMLNITRPTFFVPVHGEYRHLIAHSRLALELGVPEENTFALEDGDVLEITKEEGRIVGRVPAGHIYVDGLQLWGMESVVLRDRRTLSRDGIVVVILTVDKTTGQVLKLPEVVSSGFVEPEGHTDLMERAAQAALKAVDHKGPSHPLDWSYLTVAVKESLSAFLYEETHQRPLIIPVPVEI